MKRLLIFISFTGLAMTILPSVLVFSRLIDLQTHFTLMAAGMVLWFMTAPFWMKSKKLDE
ncbi:MAG: hypothetical protein AB7D05_07670 [Mangrovibacterium sp.]